MKNKFKSKKSIAIIVVVVLILALIVVMALKKDDSQELDYETVQIETKTLTTTISGTGKIVAENSKTVTSQLVNYKVTKVNVKVGDKVNVGDVLCTFDTADLAKTVNDLQASIDAGTISGNASVTGVEASVQSAQVQRDMQLNPMKEQLDGARQEYDNHNAALQTSKADLANVQNQLNAAQAQGDGNVVANLTEQVAAKQAIVAQQEEEVKIYRDAYVKLQESYDQQSQILNASITGVQAQLDSTRAQTSVGTLTYEQQLSAYRKQLADTNLKATEAGTVTAVNVKPGDYYAGGALITIEGVESLVLETEIDEYDIADVKEGMEVIIKTDSTRDELLSGTVTSVAPAATGSVSSTSATSGMGMSSMSMMGMSGTSSSGSATYTVKIAINTPNDRLRLGMNAKLNIITQKSENVLAVPYDAVTENDDGTKYITIIKDDGSEENITVTTGLESGYYTEVASEKISVGMNVKLPKVSDTTSVDELLNNVGATGGM